MQNVSSEQAPSTSATPVLRPAQDRRGVELASLTAQPASEAGQLDTAALDSKQRRTGIVHFLALSLGALGVVFGDIGTSPLYTFAGIYHEVKTASSVQPDQEDIAGAFSLIFWTLTWVTCLKYVVIVMRFSHHGEGGTFALMQCILSASEGDVGDVSDRTKVVLKFLGVLGCSLLIGDGAITPVISVLSAVEIVPVEVSQSMEILVGIAILVLIFLAQRCGSRLIGTVAGPIMLCWFLTIGALGVYNLLRFPDEAGLVVQALNPAAVWRFFVTGHFRGAMAWRALAGVVLCVTGAEALYADMGHFGAGPITLAWFGLIYPSLVAQYMGMTAVLVNNPQVLQGNPFRAAVPESLQWPMTVLSIVAAALASQSLISGVFSLLTQAHALGLLPRVLVRHTNPEEEGQVFIPEANVMLCLACISLCVGFGNSAAIGGAYGIAVTGTFIVTSVALVIAFRKVWRLSWLSIMLLGVPMLLIDIMFWTSNMMKIIPSGWVPLAIAFSMCTIMLTFSWGRHREREMATYPSEEQAKSLFGVDCGTTWIPSIASVDDLCAMLSSESISRTDAAAVFLTPAPRRVPRSLSVLASSFNSLPRVVVLLCVQIEQVPFICDERRYEFEDLDSENGLYQVILHFGYAEPLTVGRLAIQARLHRIVTEHSHRHPDLQLLVSHQRSLHFVEDLEAPMDAETPSVVDFPSMNTAPADTDVRRITFVFNKLHYVPVPGSGVLARMRVKLYNWLVLNSRKPISFFGLESCNAMEISSVRFM